MMEPYCRARWPNYLLLSSLEQSETIRLRSGEDCVAKSGTSQGHKL